MYWFLYDSTGTIKEAQLVNVTEWTNLNGYAGALSVDMTDATAQDAYLNKSHYTIQNGALVKTVTDAQLLQEAKQAQIASIRQGYAQTLAGGFNATIGTTQYTFGWSTDDKSNLNATQKAIDKGFLTFPIQYADVHGNPVTLSSQADLDTIEHTATNFFSAQHQQVLNLIGQVNSATTVSGVQSILWTPATY